MKKVKQNCWLLIIFMIFGCQKESTEIEEIAKDPTEINLQKSGGLPSENGNELVIYYPEGTTEEEKAALRAEYEVQEFKDCKCADENLELWIFSEQQSQNGGIEEKAILVKGESEEEIEGVNFNPSFEIIENNVTEYTTVQGTNVGMNLMVNSNQGVTVAVLDTGIMYDYDGFTTPFLYNASEDACTDNGHTEIFGWNFVDNNNNPYDDYPGKHGTIISNIIASNLQQANVSFQILPVKVANANGKIRYFDALCGFQYAAKKPEVKIINTSFGWYNQQFNLLEEFIKNVEEDILVVSSAGNKGTDNDTNPHYPSSYASENLLAIAALDSESNANNENSQINNTFYNGNSTFALAYFSNKGIESVDIAAPGENIPFTIKNKTFYISGTSYSAAYISYISGKLYQQSMYATQLKETVIANSIYHPLLYEIKHSSYYID